MAVRPQGLAYIARSFPAAGRLSLNSSLIGRHITPIFSFYRAVPGTPLPSPADPTALGTLPIAAYRYCVAATEASRFGWYVFMPASIQVAWDGEEVIWASADSDAWHRLTSIQHGGFQTLWDSVAPASLTGMSPPFITATHHPGVLQIWTGLFMRTLPGWSILVRAPANVPSAAGYQLYEGIIETDEWFGPLFINLRLTKTDYPVTFDSDRPIFQIQPVPRGAYASATQRSIQTVTSLKDFAPSDWSAFGKIMDRKHDEAGSIGGYATHVRRRAKADR